MGRENVIIQLFLSVESFITKTTFVGGGMEIFEMTFQHSLLWKGAIAGITRKKLDISVSYRLFFRDDASRWMEFPRSVVEILNTRMFLQNTGGHK